MQPMPSMNVIEDSLQFHRAFPWLPAPGQAVFVFAGKLPGSEVDGRFALLTDSAHDGGKLRDVHRNSGVNVVTMPVKAGAQAQEPFEYGTHLQAAIREGIATVWQAAQRPGRRPDGRRQRVHRRRPRPRAVSFLDRLTHRPHEPGQQYPPAR